MISTDLILTRDELVILASTIYDLAHYGKVDPRNGLTTSKEYLTPFTCYCLSNILKKVVEKLNWDIDTYIKEYSKLREGTNLGK